MMLESYGEILGKENLNSDDQQFHQILTKQTSYLNSLNIKRRIRGRHGCDCMVVEFTTTNAISAYHH